MAQRGQALPGDVPGAIRNLFDHYEEWAGVALRMLEQEERVPEIGALTSGARQVHAEWVERVFAEHLDRCSGPARVILRGQLVALTDVYVWKILRVDQGLDREAAERAVRELAEAITTYPGGR
jgi:hypothetical protein